MPVMMDELEKVTGGADPMIAYQEVVYYDAAGNRYVLRVKEPELPDIISQKVTYTDGNGTVYVLEK